MSRIGRKPISIPAEVKVEVDNRRVLIQGPKGQLEQVLPREIKAEVKQDQLIVSVAHPSERSSALWGLFRALLANDVRGVVEGFQKELELVGVGYRARLEGSELVMELGFSHDVRIKPDPGIEFRVPENNRVIIFGIRKDKIGQVAHAIRKIRPPEPYKGKGIRYAGEQVRHKEGKKAATGTV